MFGNSKTLFASFLLLAIFIFAAPLAADARGGEADAIVKHLKTKYHAKKVGVPMMWLARLAVKVVRPAGVQSFNITMFENLQFSPAALDGEMQSAMRNSLSAEWSPLLRVRSRADAQVYMYMREAGKSVRMMLVTIDKNQAVVVRATFSPEKFIEFVDNPKIFGVSLSDTEQQANTKLLKEKEETISERKTEKPKKNQ
jgi:hypothetical protein